MLQYINVLQPPALLFHVMMCFCNPFEQQMLAFYQVRTVSTEANR